MLLEVQRVAGGPRIVGHFLVQGGEIVNTSLVGANEVYLIQGQTIFQTARVVNESELYGHRFEGPRAIIQDVKVPNTSAFYAHLFEKDVLEAAEITNESVFRAHVFEKHVLQTAEIVNTNDLYMHDFEKNVLQTAEIVNTNEVYANLIQFAGEMVVSQSAEIVNTSSFYSQLIEKDVSQSAEIVNSNTLNAHVFEKDVLQASQIVNSQTFHSEVIEKDVLQTAEIVNTSSFNTDVFVKWTITLSETNVEENSILNDVVGVLGKSGGLAGEVLTLSLSDDNGGRFAISGSNLVVNSALRAEFNYDQATTRNITVLATGDLGSLFSKTFTLTVNRAVGWDPRYRMSTYTMDPSGFTNMRVAKGTNAAGTIGPVYGDSVMTTGKYYWEVHLAANATNNTVAFGLSAFGMSNPSGAEQGVIGAFWRQDGLYGFPGSSSAGHTTFTMTTDVLMFAYDGATGKVWFGKNGTWNQSGSVGDPAAGTNPAVTLGATDRRPMRAVMFTGAIASGNNIPATMCGTAAQQTYSAPSGFSPLAYTATPTVKFDAQVHADFTIRDSGLNVIKSTSTSERVACVNAGGFGKFVWAMRINQQAGLAHYGMQPIQNVLTSVSFTATLIRSSDGLTAKSGSTTGTPTYGALAAGDILMYAADMNTGKQWFGKNGTWFSSGDPGAGTGEAFTETGSAIFNRVPFAAMTTVGDNVDFLSGNNYPYDIPTGFRSLEADPIVELGTPTTTPPTDQPDYEDPATPVTDSASDPTQSAILNTQNSWNRSGDASTSLLADTLFQSYGIVSPGSVGSVRAVNPIYGRKYWETRFWAGSNLVASCGVGDSSANIQNAPGEDSHGWGYRNDGKLRSSATDQATYSSWNSAYSTSDRIGIAYDSVTRKIWFSKNGVWQSGTPGSVSGGTVTMTIASPCVVTKTSHGLSTNDQVMFTTTGALATGVESNVIYYINVINANTFNLKATPSGSNINTTGSQSGTHTYYIGVGSTPSATLASGTYYPMNYIDNSSGSDYNYMLTAYSSFHWWGWGFRNRRYPIPLGFTAFAQF